MSILTPLPASLPWYAKLLYAVPVIGWIARDVVYGTPDNIWYALMIAATVWILAVANWGLVAVTLPFVAAVPLCFVMLLVISRA